MILMPVFLSIISPPPAKKFDKKIIFLHSFDTEETFSTFVVVENVHLLSDFQLIMERSTN